MMTTKHLGSHDKKKHVNKLTKETVISGINSCFLAPYFQTLHLPDLLKFALMCYFTLYGQAMVLLIFTSYYFLYNT